MNAEARFDDIRPGLEKEIIWADPDTKTRTPLAVVSVHGFSASRGEIRPVPEEIAKALGANLYFARLTGHGRSGDAMAEGSAQDWMNDLAEAVAIGTRIGEKIILLTVSTGGTLAKIGLAEGDLQDNILGSVFISPNFQLADPYAGLLTMPWAETIVPLIIGAERSFEPENELHGTYWTPKYPTRALFPMAATVKKAGAVDATTIGSPALFIFSPDDSIVSADATRAVAAAWGGPTQSEEITNSDDPYDHVLAGDALSPSTNEQTIQSILAWIRKLN